MMGKQKMQGNTGKKIMKKLRNGTWVAVAVLGMMTVSAGSVSANEVEGSQVTGEVTTQVTTSGSLQASELKWVANTVDQVKDEVATQSDAKEQSPLKQYDIVWGDTLSVIAQATDTTVDELVALNSIENPDLIYAGDVLMLADGTLVKVVEDEEAPEAQQDADQKQAEVKEDAPKQETKQETKQDEKQETPKQGTTEDVAVEDNNNTATPTPVLNDSVDGLPDWVKAIDLDGDGIIEIDEAIKAGYQMPIKSNHELYKYMIDADKDGQVGEAEVRPEKPQQDDAKPDTPKEDVPAPGGVVTPPTNGGGSNEGNDGEEGEEGDNDGDGGEVVTPVEPETPPVEEETPQEPAEPQPETPETPAEEVTPVEPVEPPVEEVTPPEVIVPGNPTEPTIPEEGTTPVEPGDGTVVETPPTPDEENEAITTTNLTVTDNLGYNEVRRANPELPLGQERVVQEGSFGKKETVFKVTYENGVEIRRELVSENVVMQPVDKIVEFGTYVEPQPEVSTSTRKVSEQVGYNIIRRANPNLPVGEERVVQEGSFGQKETVYKLTFEDDVMISEELVSEGLVVQPVDKIVEYGTFVEAEPEITTSVKTVKEEITFNEVRRENPDLPLGEERVVQEGSFGEKVFEYLLTYEDGVLISEELVSETVTTEAKDRIIEVGTYVAPDLNRVEEVLDKTDAEAYELAKNISWEELENYMGMSQDEMQKLADAIDYGKLNAEFGALMNNHRASLGLNELEHADKLVAGATQIAKDLADYGYIAPDGSPGHTLTNGNPTNSVFTDEEKAYGIGENIAFRYNENNPYQIVSEKYLAEVFFDQWMNSQGHKDNMEFEYYTGFTLSVQPVVNGNTKVGTRDGNGNHVITGNAGMFDGVGIVAVLELVIDNF